MRAVLQRVTEASVEVAGAIVGRTGPGLLILLGAAHGDTAAEARKFNRSLLDVGGGALVVSQFTLFADTRRGHRPSFTDAAPPEVAAPLVEQFCAALRALGVPVETGVFGAQMRVSLLNDGPVTIILDTESFTQPRR
jgi:D-aminoacyl-tRNA deacylase